jgi:hypothetical protein
VDGLDAPSYPGKPVGGLGMTGLTATLTMVPVLTVARSKRVGATFPRN